MPINRASDVSLYTFSMPGRDQATPQLTVRPYASPSRGSKEISAWRVTYASHLESRSGFTDREYVAVVLSGAMHVVLDGEPHTLQAGDTLIVPAHVTVTVSNPHSEPAEMLEMTPVGTQVTFPGQDPCIPPWAE
jgi:quercetin dioxygenase-like cupin family protein